jgi:hypothetical protein
MFIPIADSLRFDPDINAEEDISNKFGISLEDVDKTLCDDMFDRLLRSYPNIKSDLALADFIHSLSNQALNFSSPKAGKAYSTLGKLLEMPSEF